MLIHSMEMVNFCQHQQLTIDLVAGLNLIAGPNGSGKTNILRALQFALTGDAGGARNKLDDVRQGMAADDQSYVQVTISHADADMRIRRGLAPNTNLLTIGQQTYRGVGEINTELWRRLGATKRQIEDYVFVRQRKIDEMFDQRPANRTSSLASLFGMDTAEYVWKTLGEFIGNIEVPTTLLDADLIRRQLIEEQTKAATLDAQIVALQMPEDFQAVFDGFGEIVRGYTAFSSAIAELDRLERQAETKQVSLEQAQSAQQSQQNDLRALDAALGTLIEQVADARVGLHEWGIYDAAEAMRRRYLALTAEYQCKWAQEPTEPAVICAELTEEQSERQMMLRQRIARHGEAIKQLESKTDICPTCGQTMPGVSAKESQLCKLRKEQVEAKVDLAPIDVIASARQLYELAHTEFVEQQKRFKQDTAQIEEQQKQLKSFDPPAESRESLQSVLDENTLYDEAAAELKTAMAETAKQLAASGGELRMLLDSVSHQQAKIAELTSYTQADSKQAAQDLADLTRRQDQLTHFQAQQAVVAAAIMLAEQQLVDVKKVRARGQRTREVVGHLEDVRTIFHRNEAPRMVSYTYIETMLDEVNNTLELFEAPFRVEMDDSLGFIAHFLDGIRVQPDQRLSVGERIVLAMAFRVTVNSTFAGQVGVLVLDEPTAGLDEHNLGCLPQALERLRDLSHSRGLQVLFVTHEPRIGHLFDHAIELTAA